MATAYKPRSLDITRACAALTLDLKKLEDRSLHIVFSGPAGAILWSNCVLRGCGPESYRDLHAELFKKLAPSLYFDNKQYEPHLIATVFGCGSNEAKKRRVLSRLFKHSEQEPLKESMDFVLDVVSNNQLSHVDCAVRFHHVKAPIPPATRLRLPALPGGPAPLPVNLEIITRNPAELLADAFLHLRAEFPNDPAFYTASDSLQLHTVLLFAPILQAVTDSGNRFPLLSAGFPFSQARAIGDLEFVISKANYGHIEVWLGETVEALDQMLKQVEKHKGSAELKKGLEERFTMFHYFKQYFRYTDRFEEVHQEVDLSQAEDGLHFPVYPMTAWEPARR